MKSRIVQLCVDASTWSMVAILELGHIRVKGERLLEFVTGIRREGRQNFRDQSMDTHKELCTLLVD